MRARGDSNPGSYSISQQPKKPGYVLVRFFENARQAAGEDASGWEYDEYHLELLAYDGLADDIAANTAPYLTEAKAQETNETDALKKEVQALAANTETVRVAARAFAATATDIADETALEMPDMFPAWETVLAAGKTLRCGQIIDDGGTLYRVVPEEGVTPQSHQPPGGEGMLAVYRPIAPEHEGTADDPIPWVYGMDCYAGQYYSYNGHTYRVAEGGNMVPCVWAPGTAGLWQWVLVS